MRTARSLPYMGVSIHGVSVQGGPCPGGSLYLGGGLCQGDPSPCEQNDRQV